MIKRKNNSKNPHMDNTKTILTNISFGEIMKSYDVKFLDGYRLHYETTDEFEKCAEIRDRIKLINNANANTISK